MCRPRCSSRPAMSNGSGPAAICSPITFAAPKLVNIVTQEDTDKWVEEGWSTARRSRRDAAAAFPIPSRGSKKLLSIVTECSKWGLFTRPLTRELGPRPHPAHRRRRARHAAQCRAGRLPGVRGRLHPRALARCLQRSGRGLRQFPPHPHSARAWRCSGSRSPMRASSTCATAPRRSELIASGKGSVHGNADWVWGYDPVAEWNKEPSVPGAYAA